MKLVQLLLTAVLLLICSQAYTGEFRVAPVEIDFDNQVAQGNLIAARASANEVERIGCAVGNGVYSPNPDSDHYAYCEATDAEGNEAACITYDAAMIDTIASINTFSFVFFKWAHEAGETLCTHVTVATRSVHIPQKIEWEMELESFQ